MTAEVTTRSGAMEIYEYTFADSVRMQEVEETLLLAVIAIEGLHGRAKVNLDAKFEFSEADRTCRIDAGNRVGRDIARVLTGLLASDIGEENFRVRRAAASAAS
jgi:hypothetical protein